MSTRTIPPDSIQYKIQVNSVTEPGGNEFIPAPLIIGGIYKNTLDEHEYYTYYMLVRTSAIELCFVSLETGNRYEDPVVESKCIVPKGFLLVSNPISITSKYHK